MKSGDKIILTRVGVHVSKDRAKMAKELRARRAMFHPDKWRDGRVPALATEYDKAHVDEIQGLLDMHYERLKAILGKAKGTSIFHVPVANAAATCCCCVNCWYKFKDGTRTFWLNAELSDMSSTYKASVHRVAGFCDTEATLEKLRAARYVPVLRALGIKAVNVYEIRPTTCQAVSVTSTLRVDNLLRVTF